jgi:hypothetical protein
MPCNSLYDFTAGNPRRVPEQLPPKEYSLGNLHIVDLTKTLDPNTETRRCRLWRFNTGGAIPDFHTILDLTSHLGTHCECPYHHDEEWASVAELPLSQFMGRGLYVVIDDLPENAELTAAALEKHLGARIRPGDTVIPSGTDSLFPKGLHIGTITAISMDAGSEGSYAVVTPSVDFRHIEEVFVLREVIETDSDENLPAMNNAARTGGTTATHAPNATPTPSPTPAEETWSYPSAGATPEILEVLPEDEWARGN